MTAVNSVSVAAALVLVAAAVSFAAGNAVPFQANANGSAVVLEAIGSLQQSGVFGNDNEILRRIAYVETRDGTQADEANGGGIWVVSESRFLQTQNLKANVRLPAKLRQIKSAFNIDWLQVRWRDLCEPLYSAIAARLVLYLAPRAIPPASDLEAQARFWVQYYNPDGNEEDFTALSSGLQGSILDSSANEFFLGFSLNSLGDAVITLQLFVTTTESSPIMFTVNATGFSYSGIATRNSSTSVTLPNSLQVRDVSERNKGIYIKAEGDRKITVYGLNYRTATTDAFLALPCKYLPIDEYEYYAVTYPLSSTDFLSTILIVACEDNTVVNTGQSTFVTLNRLQTYLIRSAADLTGRRITATKPIAFFSNHECTNIPAGVSFCDHLTEQLPPTSTWGRVFLAASLLGRRSGELFRIVAAQPPTTVTVNCTTFLQPITYSLTAAVNWQEFEITPSSFCSITSTAPILVAQFSLGSQRDAAINPGMSIGDPFIMMIPPVEQFSNNYVFNVLPTFVVNYITVYVAPEYFQPDRIFVDNNSLDNSLWSQIYCSGSITCGYITRVNLTIAGEHRLYHLDQDARVGVSAYGFNQDNSYGYPGGLKLTPVQLATVSFSSATYQYGEGTGDVHITITRSGNTDSIAIVLVASDHFQGTAAANEDYKPVSSILEFQPGETEKKVTITIIDDKKIERDESFQLYLSAGEGVHLSPFPRAAITIVNNDGAINLDPPYGNVLGGTGVMVSGTQFLIREDDGMLCIFDGIEVRGVYVDEKKALCISPLMSQTGRLLFQIIVNGSNSFLGESIFTSLSVTRAHEVYLSDTDQLFLSDTEVNVQWSPDSIFPMEAPDSYEIDIHLLELSTETGTWTRLVSLGTDLPNNGVATVRIPTILEEYNTFESAISPVVIQVSLSANSTSETRLIKRGILSNLLRRLGRFGLRTIRNSPMRFLRKLAHQAVQRVLCEAWSVGQPPNVGEEILNRLPPCPRRVRDARAPNSGFTEERFSSHIPIIGTIQNYLGTTLVDDSFRTFFHPGTASCFHQRVTDNSLTGGSGQQCCYDSNELLVTGSPGGGTVDLISPDVSTIGHFFVDVLPFLMCCKAEIFSNCDEYYRHRPSDRGIDFSPPPSPPIMWGDPHILTHDGHRYTFNGKGEFILIQTLDDSFSVQARMVPVNNSFGNDSQGTVFTTIVSQERDSDRVQFEVVEGEIIVLVNGEQIDFTIIKEQEFSNVTIYDLRNSSFSASFSTGAYVEAREENDFFSLLIVSLPETFKNKKTLGLMGSFNGDILDDLLPNEGTEPLSLNSTIQEIHEKFGLTWIVDTPVDSLFTYQPGETWATFYDPFFQPTFQPKFANPKLEAEAKELCGDDIFCLFDVAATGNMDIGLSTLRGGQEIDEITEVQVPVVCDPPCINGVCVENDTCHCAAGYEGADCSEKVFDECEENPCQNGGTCSVSAQSYVCSCPEEYTGALCQDANCPPLCTAAFCSAEETRKALCTIPNPSENFNCSALCRITYCTTCYYAEKPQPRPAHCETCPYYPTVRQAVNRCFRRWSTCTRRSKYNELRGRKQKTQERFKCYEHPCV